MTLTVPYSSSSWETFSVTSCTSSHRHVPTILSAICYCYRSRTPLPYSFRWTVPDVYYLLHLPYSMTDHLPLSFQSNVHGPGRKRKKYTYYCYQTTTRTHWPYCALLTSIQTLHGLNGTPRSNPCTYSCCCYQHKYQTCYVQLTGHDLVQMTSYSSHIRLANYVHRILTVPYPLLLSHNHLPCSGLWTLTVLYYYPSRHNRMISSVPSTLTVLYYRRNLMISSVLSILTVPDLDHYSLRHKLSHRSVPMIQNDSSSFYLLSRNYHISVWQWQWKHIDLTASVQENGNVSYYYCYRHICHELHYYFSMICILLLFIDRIVKIIINIGDHFLNVIWYDIIIVIIIFLSVE